MKRSILEICVDSVDSALEAWRAGADRLVVCSGLIAGGMTPDVNLFYEVRNRLDLPVAVLVRPRFGDYCYGAAEFEVMKNDVALFRDAGADAVLTGMLLPDGSLDVFRMDELAVMAKDMRVILNRAFDFCRQPLETFERVKMMGIGGIVTSGQHRKCHDGRTLIAQMVLGAAGLEIAVTGEIEPKALPDFQRVTGANVYHFSWLKKTDSLMTYRKNGIVRELTGLSEYEIWRADVDLIACARAALDGRG